CRHYRGDEVANLDRVLGAEAAAAFCRVGDASHPAVGPGRELGERLLGALRNEGAAPAFRGLPHPPGHDRSLGRSARRRRIIPNLTALSPPSPPATDSSSGQGSISPWAVSVTSEQKSASHA